eukprot:742147-Amphidinium_carterae.1
MPYYKCVFEKYQACRFQMNKLRIITCDANCHITAEAFSQLENDNPKKRSKINDDVRSKLRVDLPNA